MFRFRRIVLSKLVIRWLPQRPAPGCEARLAIELDIPSGHGAAAATAFRAPGALGLLLDECRRGLRPTCLIGCGRGRARWLAGPWRTGLGLGARHAFASAGRYRTRNSSGRRQNSWSAIPIRRFVRALIPGFAGRPRHRVALRQCAAGCARGARGHKGPTLPPAGLSRHGFLREIFRSIRGLSDCRPNPGKRRRFRGGSRVACDS